MVSSMDAEEIKDNEADAIADNFYEKEEPHLLDKYKVLKGWHKDRIKEAMLDSIADRLKEQDDNDETIQTILSIIKRRF